MKINHKKITVGHVFVSVIGIVLAGLLLAGGVPPVMALAHPQAAPGPAVRLEIAAGTSASYRVQEQFVGVNFPSDASGMTDAVTGTLVFAPDGSIDSNQSKLSVDLKALKSDQDMRDNYIRTRTLETDKFPTAEFVPRHVDGLPSPFPTAGQAGFQMVGDMTIHGKTSEVTWKGVATFNKDQVAGRTTTNFTFATFGLTKPMIGRLLNVDDKIQLEIVFRMNKGA